MSEAQKTLSHHSPLKGKSILLGVSGSIAITKINQICQAMIDRGATVRIILTKSAKKLFSKSEFKSLKKLLCNQIYQDLFQADHPMSHINLTRISDLFIIAPISAQTIERLASARADDLLSATALASNQKIIIAPAMNREMYQNRIFQKNLQTLIDSNQFTVLGPDQGLLACNEYGIGRLIDVEVLIAKIENHFNRKVLAGKQALITVGATIEPIDPVRFISNFSSGKMGFAIAAALIELGADVTIIQAKVSTEAPKSAKVIAINTADEMLISCKKEIKNLAKEKKSFDYFIANAAVCDYQVKFQAKQKIKKSADEISLQLIKNKDVLKEISSLKKNRPKVVVGFAAETENLKANAIEKLKQKNLDFICANLVSANQAFGKDTNELLVIKKQHPKNTITELKLSDKRIIAKQLVELIAVNHQ